MSERPATTTHLHRHGGREWLITPLTDADLAGPVRVAPAREGRWQEWVHVAGDGAVVAARSFDTSRAGMPDTASRLPALTRAAVAAAASARRAAAGRAG